MAISAQKIYDLSHWQILDEGRAIHKSFEFTDFNEAWDFMEKVAFYAKEIDHHPDWSNSYNKVTIKLTSHDDDGLTDKDIDMAKFIDCIPV